MTTNRRTFLKRSLVATAPAFIPNLMAASPNGKVRHAAIGLGGQGMSDLSQLAGHPKFELVAAADVDSRTHDGIKKTFPNARIYQDYRELLEKEKELDSVNVSTPDHMHGIITYSAMKRGLHAYTQKPLTHNIWECRQLMLLAQEKKLVTQMGIQVSSDFSERFAVDFIRSGTIGKVKEVHTFSHKTWGDPAPLPNKQDTPPAGLDWALWLGVAKQRAYIEGAFHPGNWRKRRDFGTGTLGDMGCHMFSGWFRALDLNQCVSIKSIGNVPSADNWAIDGEVTYTFKGTQYTEKDTVPVTWYDGARRPPQAIADLVGGKLPDQGSVYIGTDGIMIAPHGGSPILLPKDKFKDARPNKLERRNHYHEYVECIVSSGKPSANFDYASPMTEAVLLGCLASNFLNEELKFDSAKMVFPGNEKATELVKRHYREGWEWPV